VFYHPTRDKRGYRAFSNCGGGVKPPIRFFVRLGAVSPPRPEALLGAARSRGQ
jgi:hypothetical protein